MSEVTPEEIAVRGCLAMATPEEQATVNALADEIRSVIKDAGVEGLVALGLVFLEANRGE